MAKGNKRGGSLGEEIKPGDLMLPEGFSLPEGYEEKTSDLVGVWDFLNSKTIHVIPRAATLHDSDVDPKKSSILLHCELVDDAIVRDRNKEPIEAEAGELVGVWATPGMKEIIKWANEKCLVAFVGLTETGKPNAMNSFRVFGPKSAKKNAVTIIDDFRKTSAGAEHMLSKLVIPGAGLGTPTTRLPREVAKDDGEDPNFDGDIQS